MKLKHKPNLLISYGRQLGIVQLVCVFPIDVNRPVLLVGPIQPAQRYSNVLLPDPLAPTIETYSLRSTERDTPLECACASPVPR
jgi:hypothetical protein